MNIVMKIKKAEDFGLGFNCMVRLYMDGYNEELLAEMIAVSGEYLRWFSRRTIICSLRDLIREYPFGWNEEPVPKSHTERYESLIKALIKQAICKEKKCSHYRDDQSIVNCMAEDIGVANSLWGKEKKFNWDTFYVWVVDNGLLETVEIEEVREDDEIPLKRKNLPLFYKVCNYMIDYSYGRHTYMPSTCRTFVKDNMELMSDEALGDMVEYLRERNADIPEDESAFDKIDSDNWIYMQEDLEAELLTRKVFCLAQERAGDKGALKDLVDEIIDLDSLHTQKDCLLMYHQMMGIERYLKSVSENAKVKKLLKQLDVDKRAICKKRVEFFEIEEGDKYEKIGEGMYRRK